MRKQAQNPNYASKLQSDFNFTSDQLTRMLKLFNTKLLTQFYIKTLSCIR